MEAGTERTLMQVIIYGVLILLLVGFVGTQLHGYLTKQTGIAACMQTGSMASAAREFSLGKTAMAAYDIALDCPAKHVMLFDDHVEIDGKKKSIRTEKGYTSKFDELTPDIVNEVAAAEMAECWYKMGEGNLFPFTQTYWLAYWGEETETDICMKCGTLEFDISSREQIPGLYSYMETHEFARQGQTYNYLNYLTNLQRTTPSGDTFVNSNCIDPSFGFDPSKTYYVFFNAHGFVRKLERAFSNDWYQICITEADKVTDYCPVFYS